MPPKRKATANHSTVSQRKSSRRDTNTQSIPNESSTQSSRTYTEVEVEAMIARAVQDGVEKACRQFGQPSVRPQNELNSNNTNRTVNVSSQVDSSMAPPVETAIGREVQSIMSIGFPRTNSSELCTGSGTLPITIKQLMTACLAPSTLRTYNKVLSDIDSFCINILHTKLQYPLNYATIALYIAHCYEKGLSASTITSQLSALAYVHNLGGYSDPTKHFVIRKLVAGAAKLAPTHDTRLPITEPVLKLLISSLPYLCPRRYEQCMYHSIFTLAFYGLARIGELVYTGTNTARNVLQLSDINISYKGSTPTCIQIAFANFKHNANHQVHNVTVATLEKDSQLCPVKALIDYLSERGASEGPLYITPNKTPLVRHTFDHTVKRCLGFCRLDSSLYKGHSFRIGGATLAAERGMSDSQIRLLGRWKSEAFKKYIRAVPLKSANHQF